MNIEQIMQVVQTEFGSSGLTEGLCGDFAREVAKRAIVAEREECAEECERMMMFPGGRQESFAHHGVQAAAKAIRERA